MSPINTFFSVVAALSLPLVCIPLPWHLEAWNTGTCLFMMWTAIGLFISFVNSIIWRQDALVHAPVWCDIVTKICIGWNVGIPASALCISRQLYIISSFRTGLVRTKAEKVRAVMVDLSIGLGIPFLVMCLHYIVQGHRFNIFEEIGCLPTSANTWVTLIIIYMPSLIIMSISVSYSVMSLLQLRKTQKELSKVLSSSSTLTPSRFYRLMALASMDILINLPFQLATVIVNKDNFLPWGSWAQIHSNFGRIPQVPSALWRNSPLQPSLEFSRWALVVCALVFFVFFGFAEEARKHYKLTFDSISKRVGLLSTNTFTPSHKFGSFSSSFGQVNITSTEKPAKRLGPVLISKEIFENRHSAISFTSVGDTEVGTMRAPSSRSTLTKNPVVDDPKPPSSPSFRLSVPSTADQESFLEFSTNYREIAPGLGHKV